MFVTVCNFLKALQVFVVFLCSISPPLPSAGFWFYSGHDCMRGTVVEVWGDRDQRKTTRTTR